MGSISTQARPDAIDALPEIMEDADISRLVRATANRRDVFIASAATNMLSMAMPVVILQVYDRVIPNASGHTLLVFVMALGGVLLLDAVLGIGRSYITGWSAARVHHMLGTMAVARLLGARLKGIEAVAPGIQIQRIRAVEALKSFYSGQAILIVIDIPFVALFLTLIALIAGPLVLVPITILAATAVAAALTGRTLRAALSDRSETDERRHNFIIEVLTKVQTVKALGLEALMVRRYERLQGASAEMTFWVTYLSSRARSVGGLFSQLTMVLVAAYGSTMVMSGSLSVGSLAACTFLAGRSAQPMLRAFGTWTQFQSVRIARDQIQETLDLPQEKAEGAPPIGTISGRVTMRDLSFGYGEDPAGLLQSVDLVVAPGETVAITGSNGCGKSTLIYLMTGLLTPTGGQVLLDNREPSRFDPESVRSQICFIPQVGSLFHGTILDNLTMFRGDDYADEALFQAGRLGLNDIVAKLPAGYETVIGDGANDGLPGGVKQRITIARALALNPTPPLLLFDEANSSLDRESDEMLKEVLESYCGQTAMILVSHRPSFLKLADRVYVLEDRTLRPQADPGPPIARPAAPLSEATA
jgi:ATP-binding cassette subfamily C protein LapB